MGRTRGEQGASCGGTPSTGTGGLGAARGCRLSHSQDAEGVWRAPQVPRGISTATLIPSTPITPARLQADSVQLNSTRRLGQLLPTAPRT